MQVTEKPPDQSVDARPTSPGPVSEPERIESIDVLRGFALLGILVMNIQAFAMVAEAYENPTVYGDLSGANYGVWYVSHLLFDQKFITIFSMLFGAGIALMSERLELRGASATRIHYRRMCVLLLVGLLHAHLLWYGDILYSYAMCGFVVYLLRKLRTWLLFLLGAAGMLFPAVLALLARWTLPYWPEELLVEVANDWAPTAELIDQQLEAYRGGWLDQMTHRAVTAAIVQALFPLGIGQMCGGIMLWGMALYRLRVFSASLSSGTYAVFIVSAVLVGLPLIAYGVVRDEAEGWRMEYSMFVGLQYNHWGAPLVSLGWIGLVMLICKHGALGWLTSRLAAVGRMALSNYLLQSVICTTLFYGHGLGWFGYVERTEQFGIVLAIWAFQILISPFWLARYRFGPMEWLWRSLTYRRLQPMAVTQAS